ncbi:hypothetical protein P280DRAFT_472746 [Massarina eburnea CBS 473.64]|uniref:Uncharacterized protein n=1 Tax=Massarina eburnea CBS 473.64 TaxID=1395130 RepID=A0A6A6RNX6_9PLEO|nr:hypothetical protein P280DRAFT_472746 [Massarina eburnea CBS 473.64]
MCRVEETIIISPDGRRRKEEETISCEKGARRRGKLCSNVTRRTTEYYTNPPSTASRDDASSPASNGPFTPPTAGAGGYRTEERKPVSILRRPSTRDGQQRAVRPEIIIDYDKDKNKKYPQFHLATPKPDKRSSLGASSINSNEGGLDSPGSDASYTIRTGFPEAPIAPPDAFSQPRGYTTRDVVPQSHRNSVSNSSQAGSSQVPSLTSEPDSPTERRFARYPPPLVHNPAPAAAPSPNVSRGQPVPTTTTSSRSNYRTTIVEPRSLRDALGFDGVAPHDYNNDFVGSTASSNSSTRAVAPEITDRADDRERRRRDAKRRQEDENRRQAEAKAKEENRRLAEAKKRQEEESRRLAEVKAKEENLRLAEEKRRKEEEDHRQTDDRIKQEEVKQVRFELGRAEDRAAQRAEARLAESEKQRAQVREEAREEAARRRKQAEPEKRATKKPEREKTKPPTNDFNKPRRSNSTTRRPSITMNQADRDERARLLEDERAQQAREREAADRRDFEEQLAERDAASRERQDSNDYYNPRAADRVVTNNGPGIGGRRQSMSRRNSVAGNAPPVGVARPNGNRHGVSIIQDTPPAQSPLTSTFPQQYSMRPPTSQVKNPPPVSYPSSYGNTPSARPPSARHSSYNENSFVASMRAANPSQDNPFAAPSNRPIHPSIPSHNGHNPFSSPGPTLHSPVSATHDPWDSRELRANLPQSAGHTRNAMQMAGEQIINRSGDRPQGRARQATHNMERAMGFEEDYDSGSDEQSQPRQRVRRQSTLGQGKGKRRT